MRYHLLLISPLKPLWDNNWFMAKLFVFINVSLTFSLAFSQIILFWDFRKNKQLRQTWLTEHLYSQCVSRISLWLPNVLLIPMVHCNSLDQVANTTCSLTMPRLHLRYVPKQQCILHSRGQKVRKVLNPRNQSVQALEIAQRHVDDISIAGSLVLQSFPSQSCRRQKKKWQHFYS